MQTEHRDPSYKFSKFTTWEAVRASGIELIRDPRADFARVPLRVACALRLAENHEGAPRVRVDHFVEALWSPAGGEPAWHDITNRSLRPEDDETARLLFAETEDDAFTIDGAIQTLLGRAPLSEAPALPHAGMSGAP